MPNVNQLLPFATGAQARVLSAAAYQALAARVNGFVQGVADEVQLNTVWRQSSVVASMIGQFIADQAHVDVIDDGNISTLEASFLAAVTAVAASQVPPPSSTVSTIVAAMIGIQNPLPAVTTPGSYVYTPSSPKVRAILVRIQAAGGGSGASLNCTSSQSSVGVPGGGGGYVEFYLVLSNASNYSAPYVVGAGGAPGTSTGTSATAGGNGGSSSFGGGPIAYGGVGGAAGFNVSLGTISNTAGADGGAATGGNVLNIPGGGAQASQYLSGGPYGGQGGPSQLGKSALAFATTSPGATGRGYGAGATPGVTQPGGVGQPGAAGGVGSVQITEFF